MSGSNEATTAATRAVVERLLEAMDRGDQQVIHACQSPDMHFWMPGSTKIHGHFEGRDAFDAMAADVFQYVADGIKLTVDNLIVSGEYAVAQARGTATTTKGEPYNNNYCIVWRVQDGLVTEMTEYHDTDLVRRVLLA